MLKDVKRYKQPGVKPELLNAGYVFIPHSIAQLYTMTMNNRVKEQFNTLSSEYDARRRLLIPRFDDFYNCGIALLSCADQSPRVLDIGAGTGIFSAALLARYPQMRLTLIDFADNMLEIAKKKFQNRIDVRYILDDYFTHDYGAEKYDIIISALSIHHLEAKDKQAFYQKIYSLLSTDGEFINADIISSGSRELDAKFDALWTDFVAGNIGEGQHFQRFIKSKEVDKPSPISAQLQWLNEAGFTYAGCAYMHYNFAVLYAIK